MPVKGQTKRLKRILKVLKIHLKLKKRKKRITAIIIIIATRITKQRAQGNTFEIPNKLSKANHPLSLC